MKIIFRKKSIIFISTILLLSIGSVFAYSIFANDVGFNSGDPEWEVDNVSDAIDNLRTKITDYCNESPYDYAITPKPSSSSIALNIDNTDEHFVMFFCGIDGNYEFNTTTNTCKILNVEPNKSYIATIAGIDKDMNVRKRAVMLTTPYNFIMDYNYLNSGNKQGNVVITTSNPDGTAGLSITGTSDLTNFGADRATFIAHYRKWYKDIDLSNYNELTFYARKGANHGSIVIAVDNDQYINLHYGDLDTNWHQYSVDLSKYTGNHVVTIVGGYTDYTGSTSSNTQYYHIELR